MYKAVLVIDMPKHCKECPLCEIWEAIPSCEEYYCNVAKNDNVDYYRRPDWCPLKQAPKMKFTYVGHDDEATANYNRGWNNCLKKIKGE